MKSINIPENIKNKSLEDLQKEAIELLSFLEKQENLKELTEKISKINTIKQYYRK